MGKFFIIFFVCLLPDSGALQRLLPDAVQLDAADVMVAGQTASAPAHDHRGLEEIRPALLQPALLPEAVAHRQLPGHVQVPSEKQTQDTKLKEDARITQQFINISLSQYLSTHSVCLGNPV